MGQTDSIEDRRQMMQLASSAAQFSRSALSIVGAYTERVESMLIKATLQDGWTQREAAQLLGMSKSKVNRHARWDIRIAPTHRELYGPLILVVEEMLLGDHRSRIVEKAYAFERARGEDPGEPLEGSVASER